MPAQGDAGKLLKPNVSAWKSRWAASRRHVGETGPEEPTMKQWLIIGEAGESLSDSPKQTIGGVGDFPSIAQTIFADPV